MEAINGQEYFSQKEGHCMNHVDQMVSLLNRKIPKEVKIAFTAAIVMGLIAHFICLRINSPTMMI